MKKVTIWGYWFYFFGAFIFVGLSLAMDIFLTIILLLYSPIDMTGFIMLLIMCIICTVIIIVWACNFFIQFTVISEEGIKTRAIWRTIRFLKWEEVKEVRYENFYVSVSGGFTSGWFLIDDGVERKQSNGLVRKNSHITVRATKRARRAIEQFWHGTIIEKAKG